MESKPHCFITISLFHGHILPRLALKSSCLHLLNAKITEVWPLGEFVGHMYVRPCFSGLPDFENKGLQKLSLSPKGWTGLKNCIIDVQEQTFILLISI